MSSEDGRARPSQVTVAGWTVVAASIIVVLAVFQAMGDLNSVDMRERVTRALSEGAGAGLGVSVDEALDVIRWCLYVAGVAAVITGVLGVYVLRRDSVARVVLTVAAVPVVLTSPVAGSLPGMIVGACAALLWTRPARDWFAGRPITPSPAGGMFGGRGPTARESEREPTAPRPPAVPPAPEVKPPAADGEAQPAPTSDWGAPRWAPPTGLPVGVAPGPARPTARPRQVRLACTATWIFTGLSAFGALMLLAVAVVAQDTLVDQVVQDSRWDAGTDPDLIAPAVAVFAAVVLVWCVLNAVLAWFVWTRHRGAWVALSLSVGLAAIVSVVGWPVALAHMAALAATLGLLLSAPVRVWFRR